MGDIASTLKALFEQQHSFEDREWDLFLDALERGEVRVAERSSDGSWEVQTWVKEAILSGFRKGGMRAWPWPSDSGFCDRPAFPPRVFSLEDGIRMVPGGSSVRRGAHVARGVIIMPPSFVNVGAWIDEGTMVDSHVLVGSCAQIGKGVHLSAGVQIGGVLEPPQARPVIIEDGAFIGGMCGLFEGVHVGREAVLAPGVIITRGTRIFDLVEAREWNGWIPPRAVVVPGTRPAQGVYAMANGLALSAPCIVKYRDDRTSGAVSLESALRD